MAITMFRLLDKKADENSVFFDENGNKDETKKQDFNNRYGVLNPYYILQKGVRETRQFIRGCSFFDPVKQKLEGYLPNVENSIVEFKAGGDIILDDEDDSVLIKWLKDHPHNRLSVFHEKDKHDSIFEIHDPKAQIREKKLQVDKEAEAKATVASLVKDPMRLRAIGNLFEETSGLEDETEIYVRLWEMASENPTVFIESVASREKSVEGDVRVGMKYAVINKNAKGFYFEGLDGLILPTTEKNNDKAITQLAKFFMTKDGRESYKQLTVGISVHEVKVNAPEGSLEE